MKKEPTASEALYAFCGWLTTREEKTVMSSKHDAAPIAERIKEFCEANDLSDPEDGWEKNVIHPTEDEVTPLFI